MFFFTAIDSHCQLYAIPLAIGSGFIPPEECACGLTCSNGTCVPTDFKPSCTCINN